MRKRTLSREIALKILYAVDISKEPVEECSRKYWENNDAVDEAVSDFAEYLANGVVENLAGLDSLIGKYADNWQMDRMATVDRNVLRIAAFELVHCGDTPPKVAINEAIDMAKKYGDRESGKFVNGILDKLSKTEREETKGKK